MGSWSHLAKRFAGSLVPRGPSQQDQEWALEHLLDGEVEIWNDMSRVDRRHAAGVARRVEGTLADGATRPILAAALLHDCGKLVSGLGTYGRVIATLSAKAAGTSAAASWSETAGFTRRVGLYVQHPQLGSEMLAMAGSAPITVAWAREHHLPPEEWTVPVEVGEALKEADDD